jgi:UDP-N-acetyl-D-galactosamine dehydrogenase
MIFQKMGLSAYDVLAAAATKWNFLEFTPGLVGGHCIGVDPFYLAHRAVTLGHNPEVILAGRRINDSMGHFIAERIHDHMERPGSVLILGLTFKENVPDLRNTRVIDIVEQLTQAGHDVAVHDPLAHRDEARELYGIELIESLVGLKPFDAIVGAVAHDAYKGLTAANLDQLVAPGGLIADIKGIWRDIEIDRRRWQL